MLFRIRQNPCSAISNSLSERHQNQLRVNEKVEDLEKQINLINQTLPLNYVLREDYIRGQAVLEAKWTQYIKH
ncbi:Uncharacterised protein [Actinobacillus equuli]|nr:Uncharacterised protein [Actinobacillus equuli]